MSRTWKDSKDWKLNKFYRDIREIKIQEAVEREGYISYCRLYYPLGYSQEREELEFLNSNRKYFKGRYQFTHSQNSHSPSWFIRDFMTVRNRRKDKLNENL